MYHQLFRIYVLAVGKDDEILPSARNIQVSFFIQISKVACMEPAVCGKRLLGSFRILVISHHDTIALDNDFIILEPDIHA